MPDMTVPYNCKELEGYPGYWLFYEGTRCSSVSVATTAEEAVSIATEHNARWEAAGAGAAVLNIPTTFRQHSDNERWEAAIARPPVPTSAAPPVPPPAPEPEPIQLSLF